MAQVLIACAWAAWVLLGCNTALFAESFYLDSPFNQRTLRYEIDNDVVWNRDSNFSNGWSIQHHTARYADWEELRAPGFVKWVGNHFPTLHDNDSIVRIGQGIGQNMFTPGDITAESPPEGDLPYAGTLTYSLNWQSFNRRTARNFQVTLGVLGREAFAEDFQKSIHDQLDSADEPEGWDTQRDSEPIVNIGYQYQLRLAHLGDYTNAWGAQLTLDPSASLGNLATLVEVGLGLRFGWNLLEGFGTFPAPPVRGFFQATELPKPSFASPHSIEMVLGLRATGLIYSVVYDGSLVTGDDRKVEREKIYAAGLLGFNYHYQHLFSVRVHFQASTDLLKTESLPDPQSGKEKTDADVSYGALMVDYYF